MDAEIHAVDKDRLASEGNHLAVHGAELDVAIKQYEGLPFGEHKEHHYVEVLASSWDGATNSILTARFNAADLQRLFDVAYAGGMVTAPIDPRIVDLVKQLSAAVAIGNADR